MYGFFENYINSALNFEKLMEEIAHAEEISENKEESLVRCKDCKNYNDGTCCKTKLKTEINGFCHLAEKIERFKFTEQECNLMIKLYNMGFNSVTFDSNIHLFKLKSDKYGLVLTVTNILFPSILDHEDVEFDFENEIKNMNGCTVQ